MPDPLAKLEKLQDGRHFKIVGDDDAVVIQLPPEFVGDPEVRQTGWQLVLGSAPRVVEVPHHHEIGLGVVDHPLEGRELRFLPGVGDVHETLVRVPGRRPMPGKVLQRGEDFGLVVRIDEGERVGADSDCVIPVGAAVLGNDRIVRVDVQINDRTEIDVEPPLPEVLRHALIDLERA